MYSSVCLFVMYGDMLIYMLVFFLLSATCAMFWCDTDTLITDTDLSRCGKEQRGGGAFTCTLIILGYKGVM